MRRTGGSSAGPGPLVAAAGMGGFTSEAPAAGAGAGAGAAAASPDWGAPSTLFSRQSTNWPSNLADTSAITPRPNWATLPVTARSVETVTLVPSPSGTRVAVTVALALPWP